MSQSPASGRANRRRARSARWPARREFVDTGYERQAVVPFESEDKFMATLNRVPGGDLRILFKGAREDLDEGMVLVGLAGILDPPRPEAIEAIRLCRQAGIRVKMITGDHAGTATAIGREMGLIEGDHTAATGTALEAASDEEVRRLVYEHDVFARTMAVNTLVFGQVFYLFNTRFIDESSLRPALWRVHPVAWLAVGVLLVLQLAFVYAPVMHLWFGSAPVEGRHWFLPLGIGMAVFLLVEVEKAILRHVRQARGSTRR